MRMTSPAVLIVEDDASLREALFDSLANDDVPVLTADSGPAALELLDREEIGLVVSDLQMQPMDGATLLGRIRDLHPSLPAVLMTAYGTVENAVEAMRNGAADYLVKPFGADQLLEIVERYLDPAASDAGPIAGDPASRELLSMAERVAATDATVTISGESGTGKEVYARYIHDRSPRRGGPFVAINCAAIPDNMLEAVLFGHDKGAFTGATGSHAGKFEQAQHGTLLLDEISEMDLGLQAKLLRVLQEREVERIGGRRPIPLDVRVLATTNRDLRRAVVHGSFREDLYYRLNVFPLNIPPLRERPGDIAPLAKALIARHRGPGRARNGISDAAIDRLESHRWPGNVRELENLLQRTLILATGDTIDAGDLEFEETHAPGETGTPSGGEALKDQVRDSEFGLIVEALAKHGGRRDRAAGDLGISPRTLRYKLARMRKAGIAIPGDGTRQQRLARPDGGTP